MSISMLLISLLCLPLLGALINGLYGKHLSKGISGGIGTATVAISFLIVLTFFGQISEPVKVTLFRLIHLDSFDINVSFLIDQLSVWMALIITGIGTLIHLFSMGYMKHDEGYYKFFTYLNLFIFAMLLLVLGSNYFVLFFGWEGVGICSFLLIGFHYSDPIKGISNSLAARKAFVMNRIGDAGLVFAAFMLLNTFHTLEFDGIAKMVNEGGIEGISMNSILIIAITLCLFLAATGKSAQIPLFTWLPDAMAGPTPVSALIHAATMVTAGIYMVTRSNFLFELAPYAKDVMLYIGIATSLVAAFMALRQNDIKKVLAYSTVSQLGLMVVALGLGAYTVAIFHVTTHAFFKALLFLGSGSVIHGMSDEQDIRMMGGLRKIMPITHLTFLIGTLAISGFPLLSGFYSKDEIIGHLFAENPMLYGVIMFSVVLTAVYMFRLYFLTFHGEFRGTAHQKDHAHESPISMTLPLMVLAVLSVFGGLLNLPGLFLHQGAHWLNHYLSGAAGLGLIEHPEAAVNTTLLLMGVASAVSIAVLIWAYVTYAKQGSLAKADSDLKGWELLSSKKLYWDELYHALITKPAEWLGEQLKQVIEIKVLNAGIFGLAALTEKTGNQVRKLQNGLVSSYLFWMVIGLIMLIVSYLINTIHWN
ncbi:MAG: NADH-quinone oxidoreductase subunit L [Flavobacteriales bacterium]|jgi:NADH-quinone oxidoreductase subunit L